MTADARNNLVAYGFIMAGCFAIAVIRAALPEVFANGPPSWQLFLSFRGTLVIGLLGLIGVFFLNRSALRGLWDSDLNVQQKMLIPIAVGILIGVVSVTLRRFVPVDSLLAEFAESQGAEAIAPTLPGAVLGYLSGGILINIVYFLILIPPVVYFVSDRLLKGQRQGLVFWSIAIPLALWEPLTNPPVSLAIDAFGAFGAIGIVAVGAMLTLVQAWFMRRFGFVALVSVRLGLYAVTHILSPRLL